MTNPYEMLEININATDEEVKKAYRKLAKKYHPDNFKDNSFLDSATEKMQNINRAYYEIQKERESGSKLRRYYADKTVGEIVRFGSYNWRILAVEGNQKLIISEYIIEQQPYNAQYTDDVSWETCTLRKYLNGEFLKKFTAEEQNWIAEKKIRNSNDSQYGTKGNRDTLDKIFLLSVEELNEYFTHDSSRMSSYGNNNSWWWLRSPVTPNNSAAYVYSDGIVYVGGFDVFAEGGGVRPALRLNL